MNLSTDNPTDSPASLAPPPHLTAGTFDEQVRALANETAPRLFAVVQLYRDDEQEDARIAAWGMAFDDHAEIVSLDGNVRMSVLSADRTARRFARPPLVSARLVWLGRAENTSP